MAYITFQPSDYFNTKTYVANGNDNHAITGVGFRPDFVWLKNRDTAVSHSIYDVVRGAGQELKSDTNAAVNVVTDRLKSFDSDGFTLGTSWGNISNGNKYVAWNWLAGGSQGSSNTDGSINTTYTSVNTTAGISISQYTGTGSLATVGHGLGAKPGMILFKEINGTNQWLVYHQGITANKTLHLNGTDAQNDNTTSFNDTEPTSTVFTINTVANVNQSGQNYIAYAFAPKKGFSKFGTYVGNGNADGTFVYTGFKPAFIMQKKASGTSDWVIYDNKRSIFNVVTKELKANTNATESTFDGIDILSNGFKQRADYSYTNNSGATYIYMAFAEEPLVSSNNIVATAR